MCFNGCENKENVVRYRIFKDNGEEILISLNSFIKWEIKGNKVYAFTQGGFDFFDTDFTNIKMLRQFLEYVEKYDIKQSLTFTKFCFGETRHKIILKYFKEDAFNPLSCWRLETNEEIKKEEKEYRELLDFLKKKYDYTPDEKDIFDFTKYYKEEKKTIFQRIIDFFSFE